MSCCGDKRANWRNAAAPATPTTSATPLSPATPSRPMGVPVARPLVHLKYIGIGSISVRGDATGLTYIFHRMISQGVDSRDAPSLIRSGRFESTRPWE